MDGAVVIEVDVYKICADGDEVSTSFHTDQTFDEWYDAWFEDLGGDEWWEWHEVDAQIQAACVGELEDRCTTFVDPTPP